MTRRLTLGVVCAAALACGRPVERPQAPPASDGRVRALADTYLAAYFDRYPEQVTVFGVPGRHHDKLTDNSLEAFKAWQAKEDAWLAEAKEIDPATIAAAPLRATYAIVREALEGSIAARVCRNELWNVSQMTGWQIGGAYLVTIQPVGADLARSEAIARWGELPKYIDTEIANLREGLKLQYSAPKGNVRIVIGQMDSLLSTPAKDWSSALYSVRWALGMKPVSDARLCERRSMMWGGRGPASAWVNVSMSMCCMAASCSNRSFCQYFQMITKATSAVPISARCMPCAVIHASAPPICA